MTETHLPELTGHLELYLTVWETVGREEFTADELRRKTATKGADSGPWGDDQNLQESLDELVAYGLLDWYGDGRYRIRLTPEESLDEWIEKTVDRVTTLHEAVQSVTQKQDGRGSTETAQTDTIQFEGTTYLRMAVAAGNSIEDVEQELTSLFEEQSDRNAVALTSPADDAAHVQHIADQLCDPKLMADRTNSYNFEKVTSQVLGTDPDNLEYRLYLTRVDSEQQ